MKTKGKIYAHKDLESIIRDFNDMNEGIMNIRIVSTTNETRQYQFYTIEATPEEFFWLGAKYASEL